MRTMTLMMPGVGNMINSAKGRQLSGLLIVLLMLCVVEVASKPKFGSRREHLSHPCSKCDKRECEEVRPELCMGTIKQDSCGCCPICILDSETFHPPGENVSDSIKPGEKNRACKEIKCPKTKVCMLNIQGIPMCRCPTTFWCKRQGKGKAVCGDNGKTYKSKCHLRVHECNEAIDIKILARKSCAKYEQETEINGPDTSPLLNDNARRRGRPWKNNDKKGAKRRGRKFPGGKRKRKEERRDRAERKRLQRQNKKDKVERKNRHKRRHV